MADVEAYEVARDALLDQMVRNKKRKAPRD
jgi:hypothetical protein